MAALLRCTMQAPYFLRVVTQTQVPAVVHIQVAGLLPGCRHQRHQQCLLRDGGCVVALLALQTREQFAGTRLVTAIAAIHRTHQRHLQHYYHRFGHQHPLLPTQRFVVADRGLR